MQNTACHYRLTRAIRAHYIHAQRENRSLKKQEQASVSQSITERKKIKYDTKR